MMEGKTGPGAYTQRQSAVDYVHLCGCGTLILERRQIVDGRWMAVFVDLDGQTMTTCPGCGMVLTTEWGPSEAERQREESLPQWACRALPPQFGRLRDDSDELFR